MFYCVFLRESTDAQSAYGQQLFGTIVGVLSFHMMCYTVVVRDFIVSVALYDTMHCLLFSSAYFALCDFIFVSFLFLMWYLRLYFR